MQTRVFDGKPSEPGEQTSSSGAIPAGLPGSTGPARRPWWMPGQSIACSSGLFRCCAGCSHRLLWSKPGDCSSNTGDKPYPTFPSGLSARGTHISSSARKQQLGGQQVFPRPVCPRPPPACCPERGSGGTRGIGRCSRQSHAGSAGSFGYPGLFTWFHLPVMLQKLTAFLFSGIGDQPSLTLHHHFLLAEPFLAFHPRTSSLAHYHHDQ